MTTGTVLDMQARVDVAFRIADRAAVAIEFVVDTGFAGALALPVDAISTLGLPFLQEMIAKLANDETVKADVHVGTILWDGHEERVAVLAMGKRPLLGTAMLEGRVLRAQFVERGLVSIDDVKT